MYKTDAYVQSSAAVTEYSSGSFSVYVGFQYRSDPDSTRVQLRKPDGSLVSLTGGAVGLVYSFTATFPNSAQRNAAYPDGFYQIVIKRSGAQDILIPVTVTFSPMAPPRVTNFAELQAITGPRVAIDWTPIPQAGTGAEELSWRLTDANKELLQRRDIPDPRQTSFVAQDIPRELRMVGELDYFRSNTLATDVTTRVTAGSGTSVSLSVYRVASVPQPPAAFGGYASGSGEVTLSWQLVPGSDELTSYRLERSTSRDFPALGTTAFAVDISRTSFIDRTVSASSAVNYYRLLALNAKGPSLPSAVSDVPTLATDGKGPTRLMNIASRARCGRGTAVTIGGFVVNGTQPKRVLVRAVGPTLVTQGLRSTDILVDPSLTLYRGQTAIAANDNWGSNSNVAEITVLGAQLGATPLAASDSTSAALLIELKPGVYSFVVSGKNNAEGIVLLEVYDADSASDSRFANISSRAYAASGDNVAIGGFVISGEGSKQVLLRAIGPGLVAQGIPSYEVLSDPVIEVYHGATIIATNDNWQTNESYQAITAQGNRIGAAAIAPSDDRSAALLLRLPPGVYTFVASPRNNNAGIVLVEVYDAD